MGILGRIRRQVRTVVGSVPRSTRHVFTDIWRRRAWGSAESVSGEGSTLAQTDRLRAAIPELLRRRGVRTLLDAPCGDFHWMKEMHLEDGVIERYVGVDVVREIVEENRARHGVLRRREFLSLDIARDPLPRADLVLCRDCLVHLPLSTGVRVVENMRRSGARWLLATTYPNLLVANSNIRVGRWRPLDLTLPPYSLPPPEEMILEGCTEIHDHPEKSLGLFRL